MYDKALKLFISLWDGTPVRHIGVSVSELSNSKIAQVTLFDEKNLEKKQKLDACIDSIRRKHGNKSILKSCFLQSGVHSMLGGSGGDDYPVMTSIL